MSIHHPVSRRLIVLALALSSLFAAMLLMARMSYTGRITYTFLPWNLILAWVPFVFSSMLEEFHRRKAPMLLLFALGFGWLVFYPNAPYIFTDFVHLKERANAPLWFDIALLSSFAWTGLMLGCISLYQIQDVIRARIGTFFGWVFVIFINFLCGFGVYVGRELRWNSWDVLTSTRELIADLVLRVTQASTYPGSVGVSLVFGAFLCVAYLVVYSLLRVETSEGKRLR